MKCPECGLLIGPVKSCKISMAKGVFDCEKCHFKSKKNMVLDSLFVSMSLAFWGLVKIKGFGMSYEIKSVVAVIMSAALFFLLDFFFGKLEPHK